MNSLEMKERLLQSSLEERKAYVKNLSVSHPKLVEIFKEVQNIIEDPVTESLIYVYGPTGVGKTFFGIKLMEKINDRYKEEMMNDLSFIPVVRIEAHSPESGTFSWKQFYTQILDQLNEILIDKKVSYQEVDRKLLKRSGRDTVETLKDAVISALQHRKTKVLIIDEAQSIAQVKKTSSEKAQMNILKSITNMTGIPIVLLGNYDLKSLINQSDQLIKRGNKKHFPRYKPNEFQLFIRALMTFQNQLPLLITPQLIDHWEFFYNRTIGCIGNLNQLLVKTYLYEIKENPNLETLEISQFEKYALDKDDCIEIARIVVKEERKLENESSDEELMGILGFEEYKDFVNLEEVVLPADTKSISNKGQRKYNLKPGVKNPKRNSTTPPEESEQLEID